MFSILLGSLTRAYSGLQFTSSTSSPSESTSEDRPIRLSSTGQGTVIQVGTEVQLVDLPGKLKSLSISLQMVTVHRNKRIECRVSERDASHCKRGKPLVLRARKMVLQRMLPRCSTWPFPWELWEVVWISSTPSSLRFSDSSADMSFAPRSEYIYDDMPNTVKSWLRHSMTVEECMPGLANADEKREYSSVVVRI